MIPTASEEKARMLLGLSGELTRTIKSVTGVVDARVQVVLPENSPLLDKAQWSPPTASVLVKHRGSAPPLTEDEIRNLVARGVEGLQPENVAVVYKRTGATPAPNHDIGWYLSDAYVVIGSLALAALTGIGALLLVFRTQRQKAAIASLRRDLEMAARQPREQLAEAGRG
jgi:type III secretion protein J